MITIQITDHELVLIQMALTTHSCEFDELCTEYKNKAELEWHDEEKKEWYENQAKHFKRVATEYNYLKQKLKLQRR